MTAALAPSNRLTRWCSGASYAPQFLWFRFALFTIKITPLHWPTDHGVSASKDNDSTHGNSPLSTENSTRFIGEYLKRMKRLSNKGRCLHYQSGERCNNVIDAHSIQKNRQLACIAEEGHVVRLSGDFSTLSKTGGKLAAKSIGMGVASTFAGFCQKHDNELFKPIDDSHLIPNDEQIFLYAYRCLCREYFVKENAVELTGEDFGHTDIQEIGASFLNAARIGHLLGFENLKRHKRFFDESLIRKQYSDIKYVCFVSNDSWEVQLSGVFYPDFGFSSTPLQNLSNLNSELQLVTFFTAPMQSGWAFVIAWHESSEPVASYFVSSLALACHEGMRASDALLRFSFSTCENHAIRPSWWHDLNDSAKQQILDRAFLMVSPTTPVPPNYLADGLEGIATWDFEHVYTTMQVAS